MPNELLFTPRQIEANLANRAAAKSLQPLRHGVEWSDLAGTVAGGLAVALARMG